MRANKAAIVAIAQQSEAKGRLLRCQESEKNGQKPYAFTLIIEDASPQARSSMAVAPACAGATGWMVAIAATARARDWRIAR